VKPLAVELCQDLWMRHLDQAASVTEGRWRRGREPSRSMRLPLSDDAPARTRAARCGALTAAKQVS
jgi:hypothetical protein